MKVFLLGDSTMAHKDGKARPETGWGECLSSFLAEGWTVDNRAVNGLASKDAISKGIFQGIADDAESGDIALIQFGHNDSKAEDPSRYSEPWSGYIVNLVYMAGKLKERGVYVIFLTSIARRRFSGGLAVDTHGDYPAAMKAAAHQAGCPCIDMTIPTMIQLQSDGEEASRKYYMNFGPGIYPAYPDGDDDNTHLRPEGASMVASIACDAIRKVPDIPSFLI